MQSFRRELWFEIPARVGYENITREVERCIDAIIRAAKTGKIGDGKIFVTAVEQVVRIRTGETDESAV
jgi:nitrogen regulatory protein PII